jgi:hypothetical protein
VAIPPDAHRAVTARAATALLRTILSLVVLAPVVPVSLLRNGNCMGGLPTIRNAGLVGGTY